MSKTYFSFDIFDEMFPPDCVISRRNLAQEEARELINNGVIIFSNPSDAEGIAALEEKTGIVIPVQEKETPVKLELGDFLIVFSPPFSFGLWHIFDFSELSEDVPPEPVAALPEPDVAYGFAGE